jgi:ABC-type nitrate/sulfonate/bicarbonate transport system permease component
LGARVRFVPGVAFIVALVALTELVCDAHLVSPAIVPAPHDVWSALVAGLRSGDLWAPIRATIAHLALGWCGACIAGTGLGALVGLTAFGRAYVAPMLEFLRPLPASAIAPVGLLLIGRNDLMIVAVIVFGAIWPVLLGSVHGFASVEPRLREVSRTLRLTPAHALRSIAIPSALPDIIAGARVSIAIALILAVVGEILASTGGLGDWLNLAERSYRAPDLYAGVLLVGLLGVATNFGLERLEAYLLRWRERPAWQ